MSAHAATADRMPAEDLPEIEGQAEPDDPIDEAAGAVEPVEARQVPGAAKASRRIAHSLALAVFALGLVTFIAWMLPVFGELHGVYVMKMNTALGLMCASASGLLSLREESTSSRRWLASGLAVVAALLGAVTAIEYATGIDLGIDQLLAAERPEFQAAAHPGRMGSNTAVALLLIGCALAARDRSSRAARRAGEAAAFLAILVAVVALIGYVFGVRAFYAVELHTQMAAQTAVALLALSAAVLLSRPERGVVGLVTSEGSAGFMARRLIPVIFAVPVAIGWLSIAGVRARLYNAEFGACIDVLLAIVVLLGVALHSTRTLSRIDEQRTRGEERILDLNQRLTRHLRELEEANRELESFSYSVSHDLRSPIRHIGGFAELLEKRSADSLDEQGRHYVQTICDSARRAGDLIDDLLAFSRMSRTEMNRLPVDMKRSVEDVWRELAPDREGRAIDFKVAPLPRVTGDANMLRLVMQNLLSNALKYTRPRETAVIEVGARADRQEVTFFVRDNGVGFDMRYVEKLFGVFQRLHGPQAFEGIGIGLANVKRIVQRHGGRVWAEGAVDKGATFFFALPKEGRA